MGSADKQGKLWGTAVADWAELLEKHHNPCWKAMLDDLNVGEGTVFLDAGCGGGGGSKLAIEMGATVHGLDASEDMIAYASSKIPEGDFRVGDLEELPYADDYFDAVMAKNSVQYAEDPKAALIEIRRVCKPNGKISVCTWDVKEKNEHRFLLAAMAKILPEPPKGAGPFTLAEEGVLEDFVESAGLKVISGGSVPVVYHQENIDQFCRAQFSTGPSQVVIQSVGEEKFKEALLDFYDQYKGEDGQLRLNNQFRFVTAIPV